MNFRDIIVKKKNKRELSKNEIEFFIKGVVDGSIPDYQISAMLMAVCLNGLNDEETACLTSAMTHSGKILDLSAINGIKVDKHSTGGVADTTTLILAPLTASLGLPVIKMCGRGLGHTGGTLDKLEAIPGMRVELTAEEAVRQVNKSGIAIIGQTADLAPADKILYALRDVTGTVDSIPLIAASIMSKKLAAGADAIVLDVKCGNGAFMKTAEDAVRLAKTMKTAGEAAGRKMSAFITDMNQPLGRFIGNSLEVIEAAEILKGRAGGDLKTVSLALGSRMLVLGGITKDTGEGLEMLEKNIENGRGFEKFTELIEIQGGNPEALYDYSLMGTASCSLDIRTRREGYITEINTYDIGRASVILGAGRLSKNDKIDYSAGIIMKKRLGDYAACGECIAEVFSSESSRCHEAGDIIRSAVKLFSAPQEKSPLLLFENI